MSYPPDAGGTFASDVHRRVAAILANTEQNDGAPLTMDQVMDGVAGDDHLNLGHDEAAQVISDLVNAGAATDQDGYALTDAGQAAFPSPHAHEGGPSFA